MFGELPEQTTKFVSRLVYKRFIGLAEYIYVSASHTLSQIELEHFLAKKSKGDLINMSKIIAIFVSLLVFMSLSACDLFGSKPGAEKPNVITGKVQNYTGGEATLEAHLTIGFLQEGAKVGQGSIKADGSFTVTLIDTVADENLEPLSDPCQGVTITPSTFKGAGILFLSVVKDGKPIGALAQASSADAFITIPSKFVARIYVDQDASIVGTCQDGSNSTFNINYKKGWNLGLQEMTETSMLARTVESSDLPWFYSSQE
jgi:hypothetical protein